MRALAPAWSTGFANTRLSTIQGLRLVTAYSHLLRAQLTCRGDKPAFERKMKAKQQGKKAPQDRRESTKAERAAQAALAVFEDDVLGSALPLLASLQILNPNLSVHFQSLLLFFLCLCYNLGFGNRAG